MVNNPGTTMDRPRFGIYAGRQLRTSTHIKDGELMRMRKVDAIEAPASRVALEPGGLHVMLMGLKEPLVKSLSFNAGI